MRPDMENEAPIPLQAHFCFGVGGLRASIPHSDRRRVLRCRITRAFSTTCGGGLTPAGPGPRRLPRLEDLPRPAKAPTTGGPPPRAAKAPATGGPPPGGREGSRDRTTAPRGPRRLAPSHNRPCPTAKTPATARPPPPAPQPTPATAAPNLPARGTSKPGTPHRPRVRSPTETQS